MPIYLEFYLFCCGGMEMGFLSVKMKTGLRPARSVPLKEGIFLPEYLKSNYWGRADLSKKCDCI